MNIWIVGKQAHRFFYLKKVVNFNQYKNDSVYNDSELNYYCHCKSCHSHVDIQSCTKHKQKHASCYCCKCYKITKIVYTKNVFLA